MRLVKPRILLSLLAGFTAIILYGLISGWYLNANVKITMDTNDPVRLKAYYDTGYGYREQEAILKGAVFGVDYLPLPKSQLRGLRLDIESDIEGLSIRSICFTSIFAAHCWQGQRLVDSLRPTHNVVIESYGAFAKEIVTGPDPYMELIGEIGAAHHNVATMSLKRILLMSSFMATLIFGSWTFLVMTTLGQKIWQARLTHVRSGMPVPLGSALAMFLPVSMVFCGYWSGLHELWGDGGYVALLVTVVALSGSLRGERINFLGVCRGNKSGSLNWGRLVRGLIVTGVICLPVLFLLSATWGQEFPHIGDHEYHFWANTIAYAEGMANAGLYRSFFLIIVFAIISGYWRASTIVAIATLFYFDVGAEMHGIFSRYPAGARTLAFPFLHMATVQDWESPTNAGRLANSLAVPVWLLILRPLIIRRWPGWAILPVGLLVFYQAESAYLFTTAYIDPWAVIAVLLVIELVLKGKQQSDYLKACLVLGVGALIKEPLVFIIPWVWLAGKPWLRDRRHQLTAVLAGACSVIPFVLYFAIRRSSGFSRYEYLGPGQMLSEQWQSEFWYRVVFHFGEAGLLMLIVLAGFWVFAFRSENLKPYRFRLFMLLGALATLVLLFNLDQGGASFTGYPRFYLPVLALLAAPLFLLGKLWPETGQYKRAIAAVCAIVLAGNLPALADSLVKTQSPDAARNFNEHYDAPIYLPIKALISQAEEDGALQLGQSIYIRHVTGWNQPSFVYPHLLRQYQIMMPEEVACNCEHGGATLQPFVYPAGLHSEGDMYDPDVPGPPLLPTHSPLRWSEVNDGKSACLSELQNSCAYYSEQKIGEFVTGAIGAGLK
jgi:hypothetical protein